jgi:hypothetical protein
MIGTRGIDCLPSRELKGTGREVELGTCGQTTPLIVAEDVPGC